MNTQDTLDIIIPSFRLDEKVLLNIFSLDRPEGFVVNYYLIADNPNLKISENLLHLASKHNVKLIINETNLGFSNTRNKGIDLGSSEWILLLDDDIIPEQGLLIAYARAIRKNRSAIGFVGITEFPLPFNRITESLLLNGVVGHMNSAKNNSDVSWAPTANIVLNRRKLGSRRFLPNLINGGEDIEFLFRNSSDNNAKYRSVPDAIVIHPWWDNGAIQTKRMFKYGAGIGDIIDQPLTRQYSFRDFFTTSESLVVLGLLLLISLTFGVETKHIFGLMLIILLSELLTNIIRARVLSGRISIVLACNMMWHKNCYEAGYCYEIFKRLKLSYFAKRLDVSFRKKKTVKLSLKQVENNKVSPYYSINWRNGLVYFIKRFYEIV